jgi:hypothetical protein
MDIPDKGNDDILTKSSRPREGAKGLSSSGVSWTSHSSLLSGLEWGRHVYSNPLDLKWKNCAMNIREKVAKMNI